ncbi:short chain dehydrogenase [Paenibacillus sp. RU5A]|nr:short chain dehydrogenase [Paenibacillus sp. RU5A]SOC66548.1 short chain dehydrogenase [Paenibacillus sp. RU26A]SOC70506.1 short chain dehydrogenase [Paenibacillus sp. RU5M]
MRAYSRLNWEGLSYPTWNAASAASVETCKQHSPCLLQSNLFLILQWTHGGNGFAVTPTAAVYCATKYAVRAISEGLRQEVGADIRVTLVSPGVTESELAESISDEEAREL